MMTHPLRRLVDATGRVMWRGRGGHGLIPPDAYDSRVRQVSRGSFFVVRGEDIDAGTVIGRYDSTEHTVGPWAPDLQHAGPPTALLVHAVGLLGGREAPVPAAALPARVTVEILRPVPVAGLVLHARLVRPGRRVALAQASLAPASAPDDPVMTAAIWLIRRAEGLPVPTTPRRSPPSQGQEQRELPGSWGGGYLQAVRWELSEGSFASPGPATAWTRMRVPLLDTAPTSGVERAAVVADAGSGISALAEPGSMVFVNTEITLHLTHEPVGEDLWMDSQTTLDPSGIGHTHTVLGDRSGSVGTADQTLYVSPR